MVKKQSSEEEDPESLAVTPYVCIVNPVSGKGKSIAKAKAIAKRLRNHGHSVSIIETKPDGDAFSERCRVIPSNARVICVGGDGTLLYFLNHCKKYDGIAFYGTGTANVLTHEFHLPRDTDAFVTMLENDRRIHIRPGQTQDGTRFLMMCSFGVDGYLISKVSQTRKNQEGRFAFIIPAFRALRTYTYPDFKLTLDDERQIAGTFIMVSRIKRYGGSYVAAPDADPRLPSFQVIVFTGKGFWKTLGFFLLLRLGLHQRWRLVKTETAEKVHIPKLFPGYCQLDGDLVPFAVTELTVAEGKIPIIIPG